MALKFSFNKMRTAVAGFLTGSDTAGTSLAAGEESVFVPKMRLAKRIVDWNAALTLYPADSGSWIVATDATAGVLTLPSAAGNAGVYYEIFIQKAQTGDTHILATAGDYFEGAVLMSDADTATENMALWIANTAEDDAINLDDVAKGRLAGGYIQLVCDGTNWHVQGRLNGTGTIATPFHTAES